MACEALTAQEVRDLEPAIHPADLVGGLYFPETRHLKDSLAVSRALWQRLEGEGAFALDENRPQQHPAWKPVGDTLENIANNGAGRRRNNADDVRKKRQLLFGGDIEQTFLGQSPTAFLQ